VFTGCPLDDLSFHGGKPQHHDPDVGEFCRLNLQCTLIGSYCTSVWCFVGQFELRSMGRLENAPSLSVEQLQANEFGFKTS
jgi:hypothetical protein